MSGSDFSVAPGGENDINRHKDTSKLKVYVDTAQRQRKLTDFGASSATTNLDQKLVKAGLIFSDFLVERNLTLSTADHAAKLLRNMFPESKIVNKYRCGRRKATHILTRVVAKQSTSDLKEKLFITCCYENDTFLPVLVRHFDSDSELIATSLVDMA